MNKDKYLQKLKELRACPEAVEWSAKFDDSQQAWDACENGAWMLWLIGKIIDRNDEQQLRKLTLVKARCAKLVIHLMKDDRSKNAVIVAEKFGLGEATREELNTASFDAATADAYAAAADDAFDAAAYAASFDAATADAYAASFDAAYADAAADAAADAFDAAAYAASFDAAAYTAFDAAAADAFDAAAAAAYAAAYAAYTAFDAAAYTAFDAAAAAAADDAADAAAYAKNSIQKKGAKEIRKVYLVNPIEMPAGTGI